MSSQDWTRCSSGSCVRSLEGIPHINVGFPTSTVEDRTDTQVNLPSAESFRHPLHYYVARCSIIASKNISGSGLGPRYSPSYFTSRGLYYEFYMLISRQSLRIIFYRDSSWNSWQTERIASLRFIVHNGVLVCGLCDVQYNSKPGPGYVRHEVMSRATINSSMHTIRTPVERRRVPIDAVSSNCALADSLASRGTCGKSERL